MTENEARKDDRPPSKKSERSHLKKKKKKKKGGRTRTEVLMAGTPLRCDWSLELE